MMVVHKENAKVPVVEATVRVVNVLRGAQLLRIPSSTWTGIFSNVFFHKIPLVLFVLREFVLLDKLKFSGMNSTIFYS